MQTPGEDETARRREPSRCADRQRTDRERLGFKPGKFGYMANGFSPRSFTSRLGRRVFYCARYHRRAFASEVSWGVLVLTRSLIGLRASSSSITYPPVVPSENVTISPSSPSHSVVSIRIGPAAIGAVYSRFPRKSVSFCSRRSKPQNLTSIFKLQHYPAFR